MYTMANNSTSGKLKFPLFVALDVDDMDSAAKIASSTAEFVGGFKLGPRLILRYGANLVREISQLAPVFVDCKFYDIPSTVLSSIEAAFESGASFVTVHASNGSECLRKVAALEQQLAKGRPFQVLAVTVLTSFGDKNLPANWRPAPAAEHVNILAQAAIDSGLTGIVCSPHEVTQLRRTYPSAFLVTPGIRVKLAQIVRDDQSRTMSPKEALAAGADALVIGRPITAAVDPRVAVKEIWQ